MAIESRTPKNINMQSVYELLLRDPVTKEIVAFLTNCKTSGLENTMEMV